MRHAHHTPEQNGGLDTTPIKDRCSNTHRPSAKPYHHHRAHRAHCAHRAHRAPPLTRARNTHNTPQNPTHLRAPAMHAPSSPPHEPRHRTDSPVTSESRPASTASRRSSRDSCSGTYSCRIYQAHPLTCVCPGHLQAPRDTRSHTHMHTCI